MRVIHIADVHLLMEPEKGTPLGELRAAELNDTFREIVAVCNRENADLLLIAGDLFHRQPRLKDIREVDYELTKLTNTQVVLIAGNHDYIGGRSYYTDYVWQAPVHMLTEETMSHVTFPELRTTVYGFSYHTRDIKEPRYDEAKAVGDGIQILLAHGGDPKSVPINFRRLALGGFAYVALGHIHKPEILSETMAYAGSPEPLDKNETGAHGYMQVEITGEDGAYKTEVAFVPISKRQYRDVTLDVTAEDTMGSLTDRLAKCIAAQGREHMYRVFLEGKRAADLAIVTERLYRTGNVTEVVDATVPEYDFEGLRKQNEDNLIGMYIHALSQSGEDEELAQKALYYGLEALLAGE